MRQYLAYNKQAYVILDVKKFKLLGTYSEEKKFW